MCTSSSPTHSKDGNAIVGLETGSKRCDWSQQDETELINFLIKHKGKLGETSSLKQLTWNAAAQHLDKICVKGGPKTAKSCSVKWARVCSWCSGSFICSYVFIAQRSIHDHFHTQELFWFTLVWYQWPQYISQDWWYLWDVYYSMFASLITPYLCTDHAIRQTLMQAHSKKPDSLTMTSWVISCPQG